MNASSRNRRKFYRVAAFVVVPVAIATLLLQPWQTTAQDRDEAVPPADSVAAEAAVEDIGCRQAVLDAYSMLSRPMSTDSAISVRLVTEVEGISRLTDGAAATSTADIIASGQRVSMSGEGFAVYQDEGMQALVDPLSRTIRLHAVKAPIDEEGAGAARDMSGFIRRQQTMFSESRVVECDEYPNSDGAVYRRVTVEPNPQDQRIYNLERITVSLDRHGQLYRLSITPRVAREFERMTWTFEDLAVVAKPASFFEPVVLEVLDANGAPRKELAGFTVVDERQPSPQ